MDAALRPNDPGPPVGATDDCGDTALYSRTPERMLDTKHERQNNEGGDPPERPAHVSSMDNRSIRLRSSLVSNAYQMPNSSAGSRDHGRPPVPGMQPLRRSCDSKEEQSSPVLMTTQFGLSRASAIERQAFTAVSRFDRYYVAAAQSRRRPRVVRRQAASHHRRANAPHRSAS